MYMFLVRLLPYTVYAGIFIGYSARIIIFLYFLYICPSVCPSSLDLNVVLDIIIRRLFPSNVLCDADAE